MMFDPLPDFCAPACDAMPTTQLPRFTPQAQVV